MKVSIFLFNGFESLDIFGPVEILDQIEEYNLNYFSMEGGIVKSRQGVKVMTRPSTEIEKNTILVIPGGFGTRVIIKDKEYLSRLRNIIDKSKYVLTICTGSALISMTGALDGHKATSNKISFNWVTSLNGKVKWVQKARWVVDGKFYTSSGVSAGMDMALGFVKDRFGREKAVEIADYIEYRWGEDPEMDEFSR